MAVKVEAVLFDLDGTLVDSNEAHVCAWGQVFRESGYAPSANDIRGQIGKGADKLVPALIPGADADLADHLGDLHGRIFKAAYLKEIRAFTGAHDLLARVRDSGRKVVLASSASQEELDHYTALLDANDIVAVGSSIDDVEESKPAPDIFGVALEKLGGLEASGALVVGDTPYDIDAAAACGMTAVGLRSGGFADEALAGAMAVYDDVAALLSAFPASPLNQ